MLVRILFVAAMIAMSIELSHGNIIALLPLSLLIGIIILGGFGSATEAIKEWISFLVRK